MKLTQFLMIKFRQHKLPQGNIWRGKYRLVRKVTHLDVDQTKRHLDREEKNMFYLRNPYFNTDEYSFMKKDYFKVMEKCVADQRSRQYKNFEKHARHRVLENYMFLRLNAADSWE